MAASGVLTLGFSGFTTGLLRLKARLSSGLAPEDPGSLWPKITLAALRGEEGLTEAEVHTLLEATRRADSILAADPRPIMMSEVAVVSYRNRALTGNGLRVTIPLGPGREAEIPPDHRAYVRQVLEQWREDLSPSYLRRIQAPGHRLKHYESPCEGMTTLVSFVDTDIPGFLELHDHIERALPGRYTWFDRRGRHVTLRSLMPARPGPSSEFEAVEVLTKNDLQTVSLEGGQIPDGDAG